MQEEIQRGITITHKQRSQLTLQEKVLQKVKKFYGDGVIIHNLEKSIKFNVFALTDKDLEFLKDLDGMYKSITIKRSGAGLVIILNF